MIYQTLFSPLIINRLELENRVIMAPTRENLASEDSFVTTEMVDFYLRRARGGVSMIVLGAVGVNPRRSPFMPLINDDKFIPNLKGLVDRIHSETGVKTCAQLSDWLKIARGWKQDVNDVTLEEIEQRIDCFEKGAIRAKEAGFDAIELHAAHGYALASFLSLRNTREDEYGGPIEKRMKIVIEICQRVREALGKDYPLGIRINGDEFIIKGNTLQHSRIIARKLAETGIDYISISAGGKFEDSPGTNKHGVPHPFGGYSAQRSMPPAYMPEAVNVYLAADIRKTLRQAGYSTPVITAGRIPHPELAEEILREGQADIIALSRPLLRDPEWPLKAKESRAKEIDRCSYCSTCVDRIFNDKPALCQYLEA
ncbi:NADH:flavin oxidoreductase [Chloroflexota bacterium]